ncbi:MAG: ribosome-recycling factor [Patescibacteria group bacterium]|jgi:ribosome recycling factor
MQPIVTDSRKEFESAVEHMGSELQAIRGNRAHPSIVENIKVVAYGSEVRLKEMATITVPDARTLQVQPWDKSVLKDMERALQQAELGMGIKNDGLGILLSLPSLTAETRAQLVKVLGQKLETGRVQVRQVRERVREAVAKAEREKELTEDDRFAANKDIDELTKEYLAQIEAMAERKTTEINTI